MGENWSSVGNRGSLVSFGELLQKGSGGASKVFKAFANPAANNPLLLHISRKFRENNSERHAP